MLEKAASGVLGPWYVLTYYEYAPRAQGPAALLDDLFQHPAFPMMFF